MIRESGKTQRIITQIRDHLIYDNDLLNILDNTKEICYNRDLVVPFEEELIPSNTEKYELMWKIIDESVKLSSKADDLEEMKINRIYIYLGKTRPIFGNKRTVNQEIIIDVFVNEIFEETQRLEVITDRLNELMVHTRPAGMGRMEYRTGYDFVAPKGYRAYRHIYETVRSK